MARHTCLGAIFCGAPSSVAQAECAACQIIAEAEEAGR